MTTRSVGSRGGRSQRVLTSTVVTAALIGTLYWAQSIFIPLALAAFLTFLLNPLVSWLRSQGVARTPAVIATVLLAAVCLVGVGWIVTTQIAGLIGELPAYNENITKKLRSLKALTPASRRLSDLITAINGELSGSAPASATESADSGESGKLTTPLPTAVVVEPETPVWLTRVTGFLTPIMEYVGELSLSFVLVIFMLLKREELRNRMISLIGHGRIVVATKFVDEAGQRISRFLLMQAIVNGAFGLVLSAGLLAIGVRYAVLWGFMGAMLRYLPYIGPYLAAVPPVALSLAMFDGWVPTMLVIALYVTLELIVANAIEPWLYGQSTGVSEIALLVSAAFWSFLWGPIGLVLSSPLTVCLFMLGRYAPPLRFLAVLLGDEPALEPGVSFYQRLLARDKGEADELIRQRQKTESRIEVYDSMLVPALCATKFSRGRGDISESEADDVLQSVHELAAEVATRERAQPPGSNGAVDPGSGPVAAGPPISILGCPSRDTADRIGLEVLRLALDPCHWHLRIAAAGTLASELLLRVADEAPAVVCIMALRPGGRAHARYLCKRLRARFPDLNIIVCRWGAPAGKRRDLHDLLEAGADSEPTTLQATCRQLATLRPVLTMNRNGRSRSDVAADEAAHAADQAGSSTRRGAERDMAAQAASP